MTTKPINFLELHYTMTQFLIIFDVSNIIISHYEYKVKIYRMVNICN